jgi:hypothetical protein
LRSFILRKGTFTVLGSPMPRVGIRSVAELGTAPR